MEVTLLGTGDTTGTPTVGCSCETCRRARDPGERLREQVRERGGGLTATGGIERTRFSVHVHNERTGETLLVDFSPDFRRQFLRGDQPLPDAGVVTHAHFDHLGGLGNAYRVLDTLEVYAADETDPVTGASVAETVADEYAYLDRVRVRSRSPFESFETCGFEVTLVPVDHPPLRCYGLSIVDPRTGATLALSGDTSYDVPADSRAVLGDPDLLLADAIAPASHCECHPEGGRHHDDGGIPRTFGDKHMTREGALALADDLGADRTRLVHVSHFYPAGEAFEEPLAVDGERYRL